MLVAINVNYMKDNKIVAKLPTQRRFVKNYVALMSGLLRLTDTELLVLTEIVWDLYIGQETKVVFSPDGRSLIRERLTKGHKAMSVQNFNNYLMSLTKKKAIVKMSYGYDIDPWLYPRNEITFRYEVNESIDKHIRSDG